MADTSLIKKVSVLGAGTMGQGIAQVCARAGLVTHLYDVAPAQLEKAQASLRSSLEKLVTKGKVSEDEREQTLRNVIPSSDLKEAAAGVDLVIEAVPESMDLKLDLFNQIKTVVGAHTILASNTSGLSLTELGKRLGESARVIGLHFFNPPPVMALLEVVRGIDTSEQVVQRVLGFANRIGKTSIVVRDSPGFATSRLGVTLQAEATRMLEAKVASIADIDRAMELGYRHPMGPLKLADLVGIDVVLAVLEHLHREVGEQFRPSPLLRQMVRAGRLGQKSGRGFYKWTSDGPVPDDTLVP